MEIRIRRAEMIDLPAAKEMYAALVARMDQEGWGVWDETYPRDFVEKDIERDQFYLLLEGNRLVGAFALPAHDNGEGDVPWQEPSAPARYLYRFGIAAGQGGRGPGDTGPGGNRRAGQKPGGPVPAALCGHENQPAMGLYRKMGFSSGRGSLGKCWRTAPGFMSTRLRRKCEAP